MKFLGWSAVVLALLVGPAMAQSPSGNDQAERQRLAREIIQLASPEDGLDETAVNGGVAGLQGLLMQTIAFSGGMPELDGEQLQRSFEAGVRNGAAEGRLKMADLYAERLDAEVLADVLAFYQSPDGRSALQAALAYRNAFFEWQRQRTGPAPVYEKSAAELAFFETESGTAYQAMLEQAALPLGMEALKLNIRASAEDYCAHIECKPAHRDLFETMAMVVDIYGRSREP